MDPFGLLDPSGFPARWHCGEWSATLGWTHILADLAIFAAYLSIPIVIAHFVRQRRPRSFGALYALFAAFILSCGLTHLIEATIFWFQVYRLAAVTKVVTAAASWATVAALVREFPKALLLPEAAQLAEELKLQVRERTRAEEEVRRLNTSLQRRVEELKALLDVMPVGVLIAEDAQGSSYVANAELTRMFRLPAGREPIAGDAVAALPLYEGDQRVPANGSPLDVALSAQVATESRRMELQFGQEDTLPVLVSAAPVMTEGWVRGAVGAFVDIGAIERAEKVELRLRETQRLESLGLMAAGIAHDFNNWLTVVLGNLSVARAALPPDAPTHEALAHAEQAGQRAADLCRQMLAYAGQGRRSTTHIDLSQVVRESARLLHSAHPRAVLVFRLVPDLPVVYGDLNQLHQLLMNLVLNAAEALPEGRGRITLSSGQLEQPPEGDLPGGTHVFVEVADDGVGMEPDVQRRMFDPFFTTKFTGRGLGLAAALGIVRAHDGRIEVNSTPGQGTRIRVLLPVRATDPKPTPAVVSPAHHRWRVDGVVLVVDDEPAVRRAAARMLQALGFEVWTAADGQDAVHQFSHVLDQVRVVMLDLTMPRLSGRETLAALRAVRAELPMLLTTGFSHHDASAYGLRDGMTGFLEKPYTLQQLRDAMRTLLGDDRQ